MPSELAPIQPGQLTREPGNAIAYHEPTPMEMIAAIARDPNIPIERIAAIIGLQERMEARDAEKQFNAAFAAAMIEMPKVAKRGKKDMGAKGVIPYETYDDLDAAIRPIEAKHGFARSFTTRPSADGKRGCIMVLRLTHRAGHSITSERFCPPDPGPGRAGIQEEGSGESYGRRYATKAIWNIVTVGADDDANSADPISDEQALGIRDMLGVLAMPPTQLEKFWQFVGTSDHRPEAIQRKDYERVVGALKSRIQGKGVAR